MTETAEPEEVSASAPAEPTSAVAEPTGAAVGVLEQVRERGFITTGEIFAAFPDLEPDTNELRELWEMFESRGIKVLDEIAEELQREDQRRAGGGSAPAAPAPAPRRRVSEHRPNTARPGSSRTDDNENADAELAAVRSSARVTHTEAGGSFDPVRMYLKEIGKVPLL